MEQIVHLINQLQLIISVIGLAAVSLFVTIGGVMWATAGGSVHQVERGKAAITQALTGLVIIVLANAIVQIVKNALPG